MPNNTYVVKVAVPPQYGDSHIIEVGADTEDCALYKAARSVSETLSIPASYCSAQVLVDETLFLNLENREDQAWMAASKQNTRNWWFTLCSAVLGIVAGCIVVYFLSVGR